MLFHTLVSWHFGPHSKVRRRTHLKTLSLPPSLPIYVCMYVCMHVCIHACMYMYVCMDVCMCVCMHIPESIHTCLFVSTNVQALQGFHSTSAEHHRSSATCQHPDTTCSKSDYDYSRPSLPVVIVGITNYRDASHLYVIDINPI